MKYLQLTIQEPSEYRNPMHTFLVESDVASLAQLWNWTTAPENLDLMLFRVIGDREAYTAALDEAAFVTNYVTASLDDESFYVYIEHATRETDHTFREPFLNQQVLTVPPIEFTDEGTTRLAIIGRPTNVQAVIDAFPPEINVQIERISTYEQGLSLSTSLLTARQQEALTTAVELGYYDVPRTATVEDVATEMDCTSSTASTHLQKAQSTLAQHLVTNSHNIWSK